MANAPLTADRFAAALVECVLPSDTNRDRPVVLACDDEMAEQATRPLGIDASDAVDALTACCTARWGITTERGIYAVKSELERWHWMDAPRPAPALLVLLALWTIAANRMDSNEEGRAHGYYRDAAVQPGAPRRVTDAILRSGSLVLANIRGSGRRCEEAVSRVGVGRSWRLPGSMAGRLSAEHLCDGHLTGRLAKSIVDACAFGSCVCSASSVRRGR